MADSIVKAGGAPTASTILVNTDQVSIQGDGSIDHPIHAVPGGVGVVVDHVTIDGDGTDAHPLEVIPLGLADRVPVLSDGTTIVGDGTSGLPLTAVGGGGGGAIFTDGVTIGGFGTALVPVTAIFSGFDGNVAVVTDASLTGNGKTGSPLSVVSTGGVPMSFSYVVTGAEPDLANLIIPLPLARANANYFVFPSQASCLFLLGMKVTNATKTTTQFVLNLSAGATAGDVFDFYVTNSF